jgi:hypothetical protein
VLLDISWSDGWSPRQHGHLSCEHGDTEAWLGADGDGFFITSFISAEIESVRLEQASGIEDRKTGDSRDQLDVAVAPLDRPASDELQ